MSKDSIRKRTGVFLDNLQRSDSFGQLNHGQFFTGSQNSLTAGSETIVTQSNSHRALTGAAAAILPMQIATGKMVRDENGKETLERISFTMLINPETWNLGSTNASQSAYTRDGWVPQLWGPNQGTISSTGRTAAFMTPSTGLDYYNDQLSFGYLNFLALISAYRNNGYIFQDMLGVNELTRVIKTVHGIQILYDGQTFCGHFNTFTIDEVEETPFVQNYNFEFIISTFSGSEYEVRGHYKQLPTEGQNLSKGTANDPSKIVFAGDPYVKGTKNNSVIPRPVNDQTTIKLWTLKTGLPWGDARSFTDWTVQGNLALRKRLLSDEWDPETKTFKTAS